MYNLDFLGREKKKKYHDEFEKMKKIETFCPLFLSTSLFDAYIKSKNNKWWLLQLISETTS